MAYAKVGPWANGAPPALSATNLDQIETQYDQVLADIVHTDLGGVTTDQHHAQSHDVSDHSDIILAIKAADETVNSGSTGSTLQNDDDLLFAVGVNEEWLVEVFLLRNTGATPDWKFQWSVPASCTIDGECTEHVGGSWGGEAFSEAAAVAIIDGGGADIPTSMWGIVRVAGTAGNVQLQWAQNTADAGDTKVLRGSMLVARRIS